MESDVSLNQFGSPFPDLPTRERSELQTVGTQTDPEEGVVSDMRNYR